MTGSANVNNAGAFPALSLQREERLTRVFSRSEPCNSTEGQHDRLSTRGDKFQRNCPIRRTFLRIATRCDPLFRNVADVDRV